MRLVTAALTATLLLPAAGPLAARQASPDPTARTAWTIDTRHSELTFRVRHLVSRVNGTFREWSGQVLANRDAWAGGEVRVEVRTASIDTRHERRDAHLRSADFFQADSFPLMTFQSHRVTTDGPAIRVEGDLTIRGVTRPVVLEGEYIGYQPGGSNPGRIGFSAGTRINRKDYGLQWNRLVEGGGTLVGDDVDIEVTIAAVEQRPDGS